MPPTSSPPPDGRRRAGARSSRRRRTSLLGSTAWAVSAAVVAYALVGRPPAAPTPVVLDTLPVPVGPWSHPPVRVVAAPPPPTRAPRAIARPKLADGERRRPFAALGHPKVAFASPLIAPRLRLPRALTPNFKAIGGLLTRARPGEPVAVKITAYCLRGLTRRGRPVRTGIIAADPRVFPLARHVELYASGRYLGRYLVDDTGRDIKGTRIDVWTPDCKDARQFGVREGVAALVALDDSR
jgi:3D (Asp-Asp-Asp) domain-containing protein